MTASPTAMPRRSMRRASRDRTMARLHVVQRAGTAYRHQIGDHHDDREERRGRTKGQVATGRDVVVDDVRRQLCRATDDLDADVVTETEREREDGPRHDGG